MVRDIRFLRAFYAVCTEGGFGRAAAQLNLTQPAISYQIRILERDVGAPLFERGGRRAVLTPAGRRLLDFCRRYFAELAHLTTEVSRGVHASSEPLRIASVSGFGRYVLFPALTGLLGDRPEAAQTGDAAGGGGVISGPRLDLRFRTAAEVLRQVEEGEVDLGVVYLPKVSNHLAFRALREEELVLIVAPSFARDALAGRDLARLATYEAVPFVTYLEGDYVFGRWFDAHFGAQPARTVSVHHLDELEEVIALVALGCGATVVPLDSARAALARRAVRVIRPVRGRRCINQVFAVTRAGGYIRPELEGVLAMLTACDTSALAPDSPRARSAARRGTAPSPAP
jgi:DNA-binding transcriptional LysR family regulator